MNRVTRFRSVTDLAVHQYAASIRELFFSSKLRHLFVPYLMTLHSIIRASEPLLQAAIDEANRRGAAGDASCHQLAAYLSHHKQEEANHAEWLLEDIESLGYSRHEILGRRPSWDVAAMVGSQYYWIHHYHPALFLGYMAIFEAYPLRVADIDQFKQITGLPDSAFRTMLLHTELDVQHSADLYHFLEHFSLPDDIFADLSVAAITACTYLAKIYQALDTGAAVDNADTAETEHRL
ncbi:MAG: hypothetical protein RL748_1443 [Pseudomonadota bacterium]|jgi:hypothetical protein